MNRDKQIESVLTHSTPENYSEGKKWYPNAHQFCKKLSKKYNVELKRVAGICAALSPLKSWPVNMKITEDFLQGKRNVHTKLQVKKAELILEGRDIELCLGGLKTINFYHNIVDPKDNKWATIDRHMIWMFKETPSLTPKKYNALKKAMVDYSNRKGWITPELQAVTWVTIKQIK